MKLCTFTEINRNKNMEIIILMGLLLAGIIFLLIELFLLPGISIAGLGAILSFCVGIWYAFSYLGVTAGFISIVGSAIAAGIAIAFFMKSKTLEKVSLHAKVEGKNNPMEGIDLKVGDVGIAVSRLAPIGKVKINGKTFEAKVISDMIDQTSEVEVVEISTSGIIVQKIS